MFFRYPSKIPVRNRILFLFCSFFCFLVWAGFIYLSKCEYFDSFLPTFFADEIVDVSPNRVDPRNEGRMVYLEGELSADETLRDSLFGVEVKAAVLCRHVRTEGTKSAAEAGREDYQSPAIYRADERHCRLGAYKLRHFDEDLSWDFVPLREENIPESLRGRSCIKSGELYVAEPDASTTIVSFVAVGAAPEQYGQFVGRQSGDALELVFYYMGTQDYVKGIPGGPKKYFRYSTYAVSDMVIRLLFAFGMAAASAYFFLLFARKAISGGGNSYEGAFVLLSLILTSACLMLELRHMLELGIEYDGYKLAESQQWMLYCEWGVVFMGICLLLTLLYTGIRAWHRRGSRSPAFPRRD